MAQNQWVEADRMILILWGAADSNFENSGPKASRREAADGETLRLIGLELHL
jgi:hypothetical protein